jgi:hypothetical protein
VLSLTQLIARVCGIIAPSAPFDDAAKDAYHKVFLNAPMATSVIHALDALVKQVKKIKKKKEAVKPVEPAATVPLLTDV